MGGAIGRVAGRGGADGGQRGQPNGELKSANLNWEGPSDGWLEGGTPTAVEGGNRRGLRRRSRSHTGKNEGILEGCLEGAINWGKQYGTCEGWIMKGLQRGVGTIFPCCPFSSMHGVPLKVPRKEGTFEGTFDGCMY